MSRWYGQGGHWINHGLPMYVAIDRKPENGCEIQNAACGCSGVMIRLKIVKTAEEENASVVTEDDGNNHGTNVLKFLVEPWVRTDRCVCADSYFTSVNAVTVLRMMGLRFIGVVKTATKKSQNTNVLPVQLGAGPAWGLQGTGSQGNRWATHNAVVRMDGSGSPLFHRKRVIVRLWYSVFSEQVAPSVVGVGCTA